MYTCGMILFKFRRKRNYLIKK